MSESHLAYLSMGSNIEPKANLPKAVRLLSGQGKLLKVSSVWESEPVGTTGDNYLNVCILFESIATLVVQKENIIETIERKLGRRRGDDKYAPRTMDIDIVLFDGYPINTEDWDRAYVVVPLAEIYPDFQNPMTKELLRETATRLHQVVWLEIRPGVLD